MQTLKTLVGESKGTGRALPAVGRAMIGVSVLALLLVMLPKPVSAVVQPKDYHVQKYVTWQFAEQPAADAEGVIEWNIVAFAQDAIEPGEPMRVKHEKKWNLHVGLPSETKETETILDRFEHPWARARVTFEAGDAEEIGEIWQVTGMIKLDLEAEKRDPGFDPQEARAGAEAPTRMVIKSGTVTGLSLKDPDATKNKIVPGNAGKFKKGDVGVTGRTGGVGYKDPVKVKLVEIETGRVVAFEELFRFEVECVIAGELTWDDTTGIVLEAPYDGISSVCVQGVFPSSWVDSSSGDFYARLGPGGFYADGPLADLPWSFTYDWLDRVVKAEVGPGFAPEVSASYGVPPELHDEIINGYHYGEALIIQVGGEVRVLGEGETATHPTTWGEIKARYK